MEKFKRRDRRRRARNARGRKVCSRSRFRCVGLGDSSAENLLLTSVRLPPIAAIFGGWRVRALGRVIGHAGAYLRKVELLLGDDRLGWEKHFRGTDAGQPMQHEVGRSITWFWVMAVVGACLISIAVAWLILNAPAAPTGEIAYTVRP